MHIDEILRPHRRCRFMTLLVNFVSMSVHLRSAKEGPSIMRRTCICRGNESNPCSSLVSHAPALRMQKMNMQLHEQQRRGPVSFQHSSACPYRVSQQSHKSAPTDGWSNLLICIIGPLLNDQVDRYLLVW